MGFFEDLEKHIRTEASDEETQRLNRLHTEQAATQQKIDEDEQAKAYVQEQKRLAEMYVTESGLSIAISKFKTALGIRLETGDVDLTLPHPQCRHPNCRETTGNYPHKPGSPYSSLDVVIWDSKNISSTYEKRLGSSYLSTIETRQLIKAQSILFETTPEGTVVIKGGGWFFGSSRIKQEAWRKDPTQFEKAIKKQFTNPKTIKLSRLVGIYNPHIGD